MRVATYYSDDVRALALERFDLVSLDLPIGSGAVESPHRHVLQTRMKRAGQRWALPNARRMARLRAAYRTGGTQRFYEAIRRAHWDTITGVPRARARRQHFRYARYGTRDMDRCASN